MSGIALPPSGGNGGNRPNPKERGCFQCSRRRIICDKAEPSCGKCIKKGIECSGMNRIRFTKGVARRGKLKDCTIPDVGNDGTIQLPSSTSFPIIRWNNERKRGTKRRQEDPSRGDVQSRAMSSDQRQDITTRSFRPMMAEQLQSSSGTVASPTQTWHDRSASSELEDDVEGMEHVEGAMMKLPAEHGSLQRWISPLSAEGRMLFSHFSEAIAPVMVVFDTNSNGYRELLLPMALEDEVLRRAVNVVAAQHLSREFPGMKHAAEAGRAAVISRLRKDALSATEDQIFSKFTWATLIVLLVGETVTGSEDCGFLIQMLLCLSANSRAETGNTIVKFLQKQTDMFELLCLPLLGEHTGVSAIQRSLQSWYDWLTPEQFAAGSENHQNLNGIRFCFDAAFTIYTRRATSENINSSVDSRSQYSRLQALTIQEVAQRLSLMPPHTDGAHALVWPCFVAGAETSDPDQRAFFVNYMESIYARTKFRNIPLAVQSLRRFWESKGERRWTQYLPEYSKVLVM
ncbi:hypothetical protein DPSP01_009768 [Paraphaeosphaeria sporulosa]